MNAPISPAIRRASALLGVFIAAVGIWAALSHEVPFGGALFFVGWGALMVAPAFARPARSVGAARANLKRFRTACLTTFAASLLCYALIFLAKRGALPTSLIPDVQAMGGATWMVSFVLLFFTAYYATQVKQLEDAGNSTGGGGRA
jgi:hypothetical protein